MRLQHQFANPPEEEADFDRRINGPDGGLINAWLAGIAMRRLDRTKAQAAEAGELVPLPYRGGVEKKLKVKTKPGSLLYLAMWRGLRGEGLDLETTQQYTLSCARHGVLVRFTPNVADLFEGPADD